MKMTPYIDPLPCPFCGVRPHDDQDAVARRISCNTPGCAVAFFGSTIEAWNRRTSKQKPPAGAVSAALCLALNKIIWKCPMPEMIAAHKEEAIGVWAEYWLAELRDGPDGCRIGGIEWNATDNEFVPSSNARSAGSDESNQEIQ